MEPGVEAVSVDYAGLSRQKNDSAGDLYELSPCSTKKKFVLVLLSKNKNPIYFVDRPTQLHYNESFPTAEAGPVSSKGGTPFLNRV